MSGCPVQHDTQANGCPVQHDSDLNPANNMPAPNQGPHADQTQPLSTNRETSNIPNDKGQKWVYPSEQMFYNAMKRKNWDAKEDDMKVVVPIHNAVNEESWRRVVEWEAFTGTQCTPKLVRFEGKSKSFTIRARWRQLMGYKLPFDRHDWVVDRCGKKVTYIIDYYTGPNNSFFLDVRPYPNFEGIYWTLRRWFLQ